MHRILTHLKSNAVAYIALFVALGGTSYAAFSLPAGSVGGRQLQNRAIDPIKLNPTTIGASIAPGPTSRGMAPGGSKHPAETSGSRGQP